MSPLELAVVLSAVDNASRVISQVQQKLEGLAKVGERMKAAGEGMTFAGGLIRAAGDTLGFADAARSAMNFQDEIARFNTILPPTAKGLRDLSKIQEFAISQSQKHAYAPEQVAESVYMGGSSFLSTQQAMAATTLDEQVAMGTHGQLADVMRTLGKLYLNFADTAKPAQQELQRLGDVMATLPSQFAFKDMGEITSALQYATAAAQQFHVPLNTALASITGFSAAGLHGSAAGAPFAEMMNAIGQRAMDRLGNLAQWIHAHPSFKTAGQVTKAFGIRGTPAELLVQQVGQLDNSKRALDISAGAAACVQQLAESAASERFQILKNSLKAFAEKLDDQLLPTMTRWIDALTSAAHASRDFLLRHQTIATVLAYTAEGLRLAAYEVYAHWCSVKKVFWEVVEGAESALGKVTTFAKDWGPALLAPWAMLPYEIYKHIDKIKDAAGKVAHAIARFFVGQSPIPEGPLRDLNLSRAIAMTLTPLPVLAPAMQTASAIARPFASVGGIRGGSFTVNYSPNITINGPAWPREEWAKSAREHARELVRIIKDAEYRERRLRFE